MNLIEYGAADAAKVIKVRLGKRNSKHRVFVRRSGILTCYPIWDERCARCPDTDLVGTYDDTAEVADIEGDLQERLTEIQQ